LGKKKKEKPIGKKTAQLETVNKREQLQTHCWGGLPQVRYILIGKLGGGG